MDFKIMFNDTGIINIKKTTKPVLTRKDTLNPLSNEDSNGDVNLFFIESFGLKGSEGFGFKKKALKNISVSHIIIPTKNNSATEFKSKLPCCICFNKTQTSPAIAVSKAHCVHPGRLSFF